MNEREAFEAWARKLVLLLHFETVTGKDGVTGYLGLHTQLAWEAWQARAALADAERARVAKRCAEIADDHGAAPSAIRAIEAEFPEAFEK